MVFVVLFQVGGEITKLPLLRNIIKSVSKNSYAIFLTHHVIIDNWVKTERYGQIGLKKQLLWMAVVLLVSYISAVLLRVLSEALQKGIGMVGKKLVH